MNTQALLSKQLNYKQLNTLSIFLDNFTLKFYNFSFFKKFEENIFYLIEHKDQTLSLEDMLDTNDKDYYPIVYAVTSYTDNLSIEILNSLE